MPEMHQAGGITRLVDGRGLIRLGHLDNGFAPLLTRGGFPLRV
jgi:hypothetical protein